MIGVTTFVLLLVVLIAGPLGLTVGRSEPRLRAMIPRMGAALVGALVGVWCWNLAQPDAYYGPDSGRRYWDAVPSMQPFAIVAIAITVLVGVLLLMAGRRWNERTTTIPPVATIGLLGMPVVAIALFVVGAAIGGGH